MIPDPESKCGAEGQSKIQVRKKMKEVNALLADEDVPAAGRFNSGPAHHAGDGSPAGSTPAAGTNGQKPKYAQAGGGNPAGIISA